MLFVLICQVVIGMDVAASEFYTEDQTYDLNFKEEVNVSFFPLKFFEVLMPPFMMLVSLFRTMMVPRRYLEIA
jgi:hypothetical protein